MLINDNLPRWFVTPYYILHFKKCPNLSQIFAIIMSLNDLLWLYICIYIKLIAKTVSWYKKLIKLISIHPFLLIYNKKNANLWLKDIYFSWLHQTFYRFYHVVNIQNSNTRHHQDKAMPETIIWLVPEIWHTNF